MGYKRKVKTYVLDFEGDAEFDGLEVKATGLNIGDYMDVAALASNSAKDVTPLLEAFANSLVSWNLEDDNGPVPANLDGIKSQDIEFIMTLISSWMRATAGVKTELGKDSTSGGNSLEASMLTEGL